MLRLLRTPLDLALPPRCPACGEIVEADGRFCGGCWGQLSFLGPPWCARCQAPFELDQGEEACCDACLRAPPRHAGVRAAVAYGEIARRLALGIKYGGRRGHARVAALLMRRHLPADADVLVPVPLHPRRLWWRGYNQAGWIADTLARLTGVPVAHAALRRTRATAPLRGHGREARRRAVAGAFAATAPLVGGHVVLVDDVYTTGATAAACTEALLAGGAARVTVLTFARVIDHGEGGEDR